MSFSWSIFNSEAYLAINFLEFQILGKVLNHHLKKTIKSISFPHPSYNSFLYSFIASQIDSTLELFITGLFDLLKTQHKRLKLH